MLTFGLAAPRAADNRPCTSGIVVADPNFLVPERAQRSRIDWAMTQMA
jgi:hypothetical protein